MADPPIDPASLNEESASPAEAYARFRQRQSSPLLAAFADRYPFALDDYQREACRHVETGSGVLVAAPTGAGKTVVGEFAVFLALRTGRKCFYTTPIKALSNQKYADLVRRHGSSSVGLLTGDTSVNSEAPIVVMTTEVLRNMIYARSATLSNLGYVVLDEVHYLADRFRGAVWEEVIIGLADAIQLIALSATVSNAEEFGEWLSEVRGEMAVVVSERRPVPLFQHVLVRHRLYDLFAELAPTARELPGEDRPDVNPMLIKIAREESRLVRDDARRPRRRSGRGKRTVSYGSGAYGGAASRSSYAGAGRGRSSLRAPSRPELVEMLDDEALLPAIVFIFSRVGCDAAVRQLLESGVRLTTAAEQQQIAAILERHIVGLSDGDLRALDYDLFAEALNRGVAAHHAGMLPTFKACVEEAFVRGLIRVVFATETLALGINMPARSVVLEKLVKFDGETHADVTPGEYTQLTGRAGRRGIDVEGHAVVLWQPGLDPRAVAGLASRRTYPLRSSFAPTYCYGMTETSPVSTMTRREDDLERRVSTVGTVMPHVEVEVVDPDTGLPAPTGSPGELCTRGYSVMLRYWDEPGLTAESVDEARWMHTGDLATMDEEGYIAIVGRIKDMVIRGGENVYPREIEEFLYNHPDIEDVQVIGVPDEKYGEELMAWVRLRPDADELTIEALRAYCDGKIAHYKVPRHLHLTDEFPMTVTGKVRKVEMRERSVELLGLA